MHVLPIFRRGLFVATAGAVLGFAASASAQQCPDWQLGGVPIATNADEAWTPQQYTMYAGGMLNLLECSTVDGVGHFTAAPSFSLSYDDLAMGRDLQFRVDGSCDTTMLVNSANGEWFFDDDTDMMNPAVTLAGAVSGRYDIWVGTYGDASCAATLIAETLNSGGGGGQAGAPMCPDWSVGGAPLNLAVGQQAQQPVQAGGPVNMFEASCEIPAHGYLSHAPNFTLYFENMGQTSTIDISVTGECDQTLLMTTPTGEWMFNDDDNDLHPGIQMGDADSGRYDIWVGSFGQGGCASTLMINTYGPPAPQGQPAAPSK